MAQDMYSSPKNGLAFMGISTGSLLGFAGTFALLLTAETPVPAVLNVLIFAFAAGIILLWLRRNYLSDTVVWAGIAGFTVLELVICVACEVW